MMKLERLNRYQGVNLYARIFDDSIDDEMLRKEFTPFGTNHKVLRLCPARRVEAKGSGIVRLT